MPKPGEDRPHYGRVAIITVVGFAIGVLWPRLAGVKLVPSPPQEAAETPGSSENPAAGSASGAPPAPPAAKAAPVASIAEPATPEPSDRFKVSEPKVSSCRDGKGGKHTTCDAIAIDPIFRPKILALSGCPAAKNVQGTLSLGLELDFASGKVGKLVKGKSTNLPDATADALLECAKKEFSTISLADVKHQHPTYTVFYIVDLLPEGAAAEPVKAEGDAGVTQASGRASVTWEVAIVREHPKDGEIAARIMRGTRVVVTGRDGDWYRIKYDAKGSEGWVFRTAIGL
jgi:hypothetical protein